MTNEPMQKLFELGWDFRRNLPEQGSPDMIASIVEMVDAYDSLRTVHLSEDQQTRKRQVRLLSGMQHVKTLTESADWERLASSSFLYGPDLALAYAWRDRE